MIRRRLFTLCSALSLLLCAAVCVMWVRSYGWAESLYYEAGDRRHGESDSFGVLQWCGRVQFERLRHAWPRDGDRSFRRGRWHGDRWALPPGADAADFGGVAVLRIDTTGCPRQPSHTVAFVGFGRAEIGRMGFEEQTPWGEPPKPPRPDVATAFVHVPHWLLAAGAALLPVARLVVTRFRSRRRSRRLLCNRCPACGYDLRATPGRCPECGTAVRSPPPPG